MLGRRFFRNSRAQQLHRPGRTWKCRDLHNAKHREEPDILRRLFPRLRSFNATPPGGRAVPRSDAGDFALDRRDSKTADLRVQRVLLKMALPMLDLPVRNRYDLPPISNNYKVRSQKLASHLPVSCN